jgi:Carboxypeptidase regulatory-like domain
MNYNFRKLFPALALSLSDKTENSGRYAVTHPPAPKSEKSRLLACFVSVACALLLASLSTPRLAAQIATGGVTGTVKDSSGAVLPDAVITLANVQTGVVQSTRSTSTGAYVFETVPVGTYNLRASHTGFQDVVINNIDVHIQVIQTEDATLPVGTAQQQVTVTAAAPLLQAQSAAIGTTIGSKEILNLPLNVRHFDTLAQTVAGATTASTQFSGAPGSDYFVIDGMNPWMQDFRLDGIDDNVELYGGAGPTNSNLSITPPPDAIQEFRLQNGDFPAEFGHSSGGIINAVIKSGTNEFHGDLWEFVRNDAFNANDYFAKQYGQSIPELRYNQFGGTIGGPVIIPKIYNGKNKTFFFFDYQGTRIVGPSSYTDNVPTALEQSSDFTNYQDLITAGGSQTKSDALGRVFPYGAILDPATTRSVAAGAIDPVSGLTNPTGSTIYVRDPFFTGGGIAGITDFTNYAADLNHLPAGRLDPNAIKLLQLYPAPNANGNAVANNYVIFPKTPTTINQYDIRIDQSWGEHDTIFGVYDRSVFTSTPPNRLPGIADGGAYSTGTVSIPAYALAFGETHTFSPTLSNDFHMGYNRYVGKQYSSSAYTLGIPEQFGIQGVPQTPGNGGLPAIQPSGLTQLGPSLYMPNLGTISSLEIMDNLTKQKGSHTFKGGFQIDRLYGIVTSTAAPRGNFQYSGQYTDIVNNNTGQFGAPDMLIVPGPSTVAGGIDNLGSMSAFQASNFAANRDIRYYYGAYFQDDWKVTPNVTLNLGVRWDHYTPYEEINGRQANFVQSGNGNGDTGILYMPKQGCTVARNPAFDALLTASNITLDCTSDKATGKSQKANFAPRIGFADRLTQNWVVRGGFGIAYGALSNIGFGGNIGNNYPFLYQLSYQSQNAFTPFLDPAGNVATLETALNSVNIQDATSVTNPEGLNLIGRQYNFQTPYTETYNLTTQYQFTHHDAIQIGYVGVVGRHLDGFSNHNSPSEILPPGTNIYDYIPFKSFAPNSFYEVTNGKSSYNSMQATYQHQTSFGLNMNANYTYSQCMTDHTFYATTVQQYRAYWLPGFGAEGDYALCDTDSTHVVHVTAEYQLPVGRGQKYLKDINRVADAFIGGWQTNVIYTFQGGEPFPVYCPIATTADFGCYANEVPGVDPYKGGHTAHQWLNPAAFAQPPVATAVGQTDYSPLGGNPMVVRGPHFNNFDASLFKSISLPKSTRLEFRAEAFNLMNTAQWAQPGNTSAFNNPGPNNSNGFSAITYDRNSPRQLQLALKLYY